MRNQINRMLIFRRFLDHGVYLIDVDSGLYRYVCIIPLSVSSSGGGQFVADVIVQACSCAGMQLMMHAVVLACSCWGMQLCRRAVVFTCSCWGVQFLEHAVQGALEVVGCFVVSSGLHELNWHLAN